MRKVQFNLRVTTELKTKLEDAAYMLDQPAAMLVEEAIQLLLDKIEKERGEVPPRPRRQPATVAPEGAPPEGTGGSPHTSGDSSAYS